MRALVAASMTVSCTRVVPYSCIEDADCGGPGLVCDPSSKMCRSPDTGMTPDADVAPDSQAPMTSDCVAAVRAGGHATCVIEHDRSVWCWGDGKAPAPLTPPDGEVTRVVDVALGGAGRCTLHESGNLYCATGPDGTLTKIEGLGGAVGVTVGKGHFCARTNLSQVACWGNNESGELGDGTSDPHADPAVVMTGLPEAGQLAAGVDATCAVTLEGKVWCWGHNDVGQLGRGPCLTTMCKQTTPQEVVNFKIGSPVPVGAVTAGNQFACALAREERTVWCWGADSLGQLGDGMPGAQGKSPQLVSVLTGITQLSAGGSHSCALGSDRQLRCWGDNGKYQTASMEPSFLAVPTVVVDAAQRPVVFREVATGDEHTCGLIENGAVQCWGGNAHGELGYPVSGPAAQPTPVALTCSVTPGARR
jgi:alpha-tubulin suppressor-like RCC1 family protein